MMRHQLLKFLVLASQSIHAVARPSSNANELELLECLGQPMSSNSSDAITIMNGSMMKYRRYSSPQQGIGGHDQN